jgi:hypothetical protein
MIKAVLIGLAVVAGLLLLFVGLIQFAGFIYILWHNISSGNYIPNTFGHRTEHACNGILALLLFSLFAFICWLIGS